VTHIIKNNDERHSLFFSLFPHQATFAFDFLSYPFSRLMSFLNRCYYSHPRDITKRYDRRRCTWWKTALFPVFYFFLFFSFYSFTSPALMADKTIWMAQPTRTSRLLSESLPSSFPVIPHGNAVSHFRYCLPLRTNEVKKGDIRIRKLKDF